MTELNVEIDASGSVYFLTCVKFENPQPKGNDKPIGWLPVYRTKEAAEAARVSMPGQIGELTFPVLTGAVQTQ